MKLCSKVGICISVLFMMLMFAACGGTEYSVRDFADVQVLGYAEHGRLSIEVNDTAISNIYADGKKDKATALRFAETFKFTYDGQDSEDSYFSNGDVVTVNVTYDTDMAKSLGLNIIDSSFDYTINGLEDKAEVSPFDGLSVKFSGVAPYGTVQLDKSNCIQYVIDNVTFYCDNYDLSNGDKVVVRAEFDSQIAERNGYVFTEEVKKYTVVGLPKYVSTMAGVTYDTTTAVMHRMVEKYVSESDYSYKSLDWNFGEETTDTDTDSDEDSEELDNGENGELEDVFSYEDGEDGEDGGTAASGAKVKKLTDADKIKADFGYADFKTSYDYEPLGCFYSLNPVQYSDNLFSAAYKITGTFICTDANNASYIKEGDTVVGEIYVLTSLAGGSVDIKNVLQYEESTLNNFHSYSCRSFKSYEDMSAEVFGSTTYMTENLDYLEDQETYDEYPLKEQNAASEKYTVSHITIDSSTDTDKDSSKRSSSNDSDTETNSESFGEDEPPQSEYYGDGYYDDGYYEDYYDDGYYYEDGYGDYYE